MSTTTEYATTAAPLPLEVPGPFTRVPSLDELERLTSVPDQRVVFRGVDWAFYERLVDSIPETCNIHVDYDGKDLEVMGKSRKHEKTNRFLGLFIDIVTSELGIRRAALNEMTWKRAGLSRGLEADNCYYFTSEKLAADAAAYTRGSDDMADFPNPDLAVEVDISPPQVDRAGIYAALQVTEVWRFDGRSVIIERLTPEGGYRIVDASGFLPVTAEDIRRWLVEEDRRDELAWERRLRAEIKNRAGSAAPADGGTDVLPQNTEPLPDA
jgi:Uma2 family endonuclease